MFTLEGMVTAPETVVQFVVQNEVELLEATASAFPSLSV